MKKEMTLKTRFILTSYCSVVISIMLIGIASYCLLGSMSKKFVLQTSEEAVRQKNEDIQTKLDGIEVNFTAEKPTLIVHNQDQPGHVAEVTSMLAHKCVNIATMQLYRDKRGGYAVMVIETDQDIPAQALLWLEHLGGIIKVTYINLENR